MPVLRRIRKTRAEADRIVQGARAYKSEKILTAEGEMSRFLATYEAYSDNPATLREKLFL